MPTIDRRRFAALSLLAGAWPWLPRPARAMGGRTAFAIGRLKYEGDWNSRPNAARRMMAEVAKATSVETADAPVDLEAEDPAIFEHPFLYLTGASDFPPFGKAARENLSRFLRYGGFLLIDDAAGGAASGFEAGVRRELEAMIPEAELARIDADHSIFRTFFLVDRALGRVAERNYLEGITLGDWTPVIYMPNDLGGALERDPFGNYRYDVSPGGEVQRSWATRLAVNLVLYALTVNYKKDQIHVEAILRRRRR